MVMANAARHTGGVKQKHNKFHVFHFLLNGGGDVWPLGFDLCLGGHPKNGKMLHDDIAKKRTKLLHFE